MPVTPDRHPGELLEEGAVFDNRPAGEDPTQAGGFRYVDGAWRFRDTIGVFNPRDGGVGFDEDDVYTDDETATCIIDDETGNLLIRP